MDFKLVYPGERTRFAITATLAILVWLLIIGGTFGLALIYVLMFFIIYLFAQSAFISYLRGSAVRISPEQFPDLHQRVADCSTKLGIATPPDAYLLHADGLFNALATRFLGRNFIVLFTSVLDALESKPGAINFYIGHELGHIHRKHLTWNPILAPMAWLPLLGNALRRAEEYTCDRYGLKACDTVDDAKAGMAALAAGHSRWPQFNYGAYRAQAEQTRGFWASFHELTNDYPWTAKRALAIEELSQGREPKQPGRNFFAYLFALFLPRSAAGGFGSLLVLVAIIGIIAAIAIPAYQDYVRRAQVMGVLNSSAPYRTAVTEYATKHTEWPRSLQELSLPASIDIAPGKTVNVELRGRGEIAFLMPFAAKGPGLQDLLKKEINLSAGDPAVRLVPQAHVVDDKVQSIDWLCGGENIPEKQLPRSCRDTLDAPEPSYPPESGSSEEQAPPPETDPTPQEAPPSESEQPAPDAAPVEQPAEPSADSSGKPAT